MTEPINHRAEAQLMLEDADAGFQSTDRRMVKMTGALTHAVLDLADSVRGHGRATGANAPVADEPGEKVGPDWARVSRSILQVLRDRDGTTKQQLYSAVGGRRAVVSAALDDLVAAGQVEVSFDGARRLLRAADPDLSDGAP